MKKVKEAEEAERLIVRVKSYSIDCLKRCTTVSMITDDSW